MAARGGRLFILVGDIFDTCCLATPTAGDRERKRTPHGLMGERILAYLVIRERPSCRRRRSHGSTASNRFGDVEHAARLGRIHAYARRMYRCRLERTNIEFNGFKGLWLFLQYDDMCGCRLLSQGCYLQTARSLTAGSKVEDRRVELKLKARISVQQLYC